MMRYMSIIKVMGIKIYNPTNSILIEGLWGLGKSTLASTYGQKYGYSVEREPLHTKSAPPPSSNDIDAWYLKEHVSRQSLFVANRPHPLIVERSVLSTFAFRYALNRPLPEPKYIHSLKQIIKSTGTFIVYIRDTENSFSLENANNENYSPDIRNILSDSAARKRYEEWFMKILPREYGILPFMLRPEVGGKRRLPEELANDIHLALSCNRKAQANVVCFTRDHAAVNKVSILVLKRNAQKGGFWQTITGGIHIAEDPIAGALREVAEETSFIEGIEYPFWTDVRYSFIGEDGYILDEYVFGFEIKDPLMFKISDEHDDYEWLDPAGAIEKVKYENNKIAIIGVLKKLGSLV